MSLYRQAQETVYRILDADSRSSGVERAGNIALGALITANVIAVILETVDQIGIRFHSEFAQFEAFSVVTFTVEYLLRVWSCTVNPRYAEPMRGRLRFLATPMAVIDVLAIAPAYMPGDPFLDLRYARIIRLVRMVRALKIARYSRSVQTLTAVFRERRADLGLITFLLLVMLLISSASMYFIEHQAQPQTFSSIPAAMWWAVVTLTTVGYGDVFPITPLGKFVGAFIALLGIGFFALPAGILASGFAEELQRRRQERQRHCPHCGGLL